MHAEEVDQRALGTQNLLSDLSTAIVEKARGVTGRAAALSKIATTRRASSTEVMNGRRRRSNRRAGNWISRAFPIVSALIRCCRRERRLGQETARRQVALIPSRTGHHLRRSAHRPHAIPVARLVLDGAARPVSICLAHQAKSSSAGPVLITRLGSSPNLGSLAAVDLELELSRRVGIGVDGNRHPISIAICKSLGGSRRSGRELISTATLNVRHASNTTSASKTDCGRMPVLPQSADPCSDPRCWSADWRSHRPSDASWSPNPSGAWSARSTPPPSSASPSS